jgi:hypothetical protein
MKSEYIGEDFDFFKGLIIRNLRSEDLLRSIAVDPMITDTRWKPEWVKTYARLLSVEENQVLHSKQKFKRKRNSKESREAFQKNYFACTGCHSGDLFLDPDIGVSNTDSTRNNDEHVALSDIESLLNCQPNRVIMVYQHKGRLYDKGKPKTLNKQLVLPFKKTKRKTLHAIAYDGKHVAMLFFSYSPERIKCIKTYFKRMLCDSLNRVEILHKQIYQP